MCPGASPDVAGALVQRTNVATTLAGFATSLDGTLHDDAISRLVAKGDPWGVDDPRDASLNQQQLEDIQDAARELYLAISFILHKNYFLRMRLPCQIMLKLKSFTSSHIKELPELAPKSFTSSH